MIDLPENFEELVTVAATVGKACPGIDLESVTRDLWEANDLGHPPAARGLEIVARWQHRKQIAAKLQTMIDSMKAEWRALRGNRAA